LFTVVDVETKYKAKNFIDTVVYRAGDAISSWMYTGLVALGLSLSGIAFIAAPIAVLCGAIGIGLGRQQESLRSSAEGEERAAALAANEPAKGPIGQPRDTIERG
jgi:AAA family ATP:ADP antiporter